MNNQIQQHRRPQVHTTRTSTTPSNPPSRNSGSGLPPMPQDSVNLGSRVDEGFSKMNCLKDWAQRKSLAKPGESVPLTQTEHICMETHDKIRDMAREQAIKDRGGAKDLSDRVKELMMH